jgi:hypothetical protein
MDLAREDLEDASGLVPAPALGLWLALQAALDEHSPVPCQASPVAAAWDYDGLVSRDLATLAVDGCLACPVRPACLRYALVAGEEHGVWGGLRPCERRDLAARDVAS